MGLVESVIHSFGNRLAGGRSLARSFLALALLPLVFCLSCEKPKTTPEAKPTKQEDEFARWMNVGKNLYDQGSTNAIGAFEKAATLQPTHPDAHLNLADGYLLANLNEQALTAAVEALNLDPNSAAARYVAGCASLRLGKTTEALKYFQECLDIDVKVNAVSFQLARAQQAAGNYAQAAELLRSVLQWEPKHPSAHYLLSQVLVRLGQTDEAQREAQAHAAIRAENPSQTFNPEKCVYLEARAPFVLEQPEAVGVKVQFTDATAQAFGPDAASYRTPVGIIDIDQRGQNDLFVRQGAEGSRLLINSNGTFHPQGPTVASPPDAGFSRCLVADINNDRFEDIVLLGEGAVQVLRAATNGMFTDATAFAGMKQRRGLDGALVDLDLTGKLDLLLLSPTNRAPLCLRNLGPMYFKDVTAESGLPESLTNVLQMLVDDWNGDDLMDVFVARQGQPPLVFLKQRGGSLVPTNSPPSWPAGDRLAVGDVNNDFRADLIIANDSVIEVVLNGMDRQGTISLGNWPVAALKLIDYDNDGWLDLLAAGLGLRVWRNLGENGFRETTAELGLNRFAGLQVASLQVADLDQDGDSDWLLGLADGSLRLLRNEGGNTNAMIKLRLAGNRSNASGLGIKIEVKAANWHALRTVSELPVEIGLGKHHKPDVVKPRWSDLTIPVSFELQADPKTVWTVMEIEQPTGSCPYLYAWDGSRFRFVTDILGSSPLGLPVARGRYVEADPEEYVALGSEAAFKPRDGAYTLQLTEELREVLYLDEASLVVVDHPRGARVAATSKMLPGRPFPPHEIWTLRNPYPLRQAENHLGADVTDRLRATDRELVSPTRVRIPQLRGLAEPSQVILDFGPLPADRPLVLVMTGWLRFGGGMANIAGSQDPNLPFPFPRLEAEVTKEPGQAAAWQSVDVQVGVPCGKTKTILVDLAGKLPAGSRRLRISTAFELHWDQAELWERTSDAANRVVRLSPSQTDLHWRGFSEFEDLPWYLPLTPAYEKARANPHWRITPAGWCTRYGAVDDLVAQSDNSLVLINGGDELTLRFAADRLPPVEEGYEREFFFHSVGWDKDSDPHVACGATVEPLPFHGLRDQEYGREPRPAFTNDAWMRAYNTRWVGPLTLSRRR